MNNDKITYAYHFIAQVVQTGAGIFVGNWVAGQITDYSGWVYVIAIVGVQLFLAVQSFPLGRSLAAGFGLGMVKVAIPLYVSMWAAVPLVFFMVWQLMLNVDACALSNWYDALMDAKEKARTS